MAEIKPKFRPDIVRHTFEEKDGGRSFVLEDPVANKFFRISPYEYELLYVLDGTRTLSQAIERLRLHGRHFTSEHATHLVEQFSRAGLLLGTPQGTSQMQSKLKKVMDDAAKRRSLVRLYYLYIPVLNPDGFLDKSLWLWRLLVNRLTAALFVLLIPGAVYLIINGAERLSHNFSYFFNFGNLLVLWVALAGMKLVHEFSHAYTAKNLGLRVPEMGIVFLLFFPCLYCNTTAAWQIAERNQRMSIAAAGVLSEIVVAVFSAYLWYFSQPGQLNSVAFFMMAVSVVSSLVFNGNPLMKFDGYFILADLLRIPNLQGRAFAYVRYLFLNKVLGIQSVQARKADGRERLIVLSYGISASIYRVFLYAGIVMGVYYRFDKALGIVLGFLALMLFVVGPVTRGAAGLIKRRKEMRFRPVGLLVFVLLFGGAAFLLTRPWSGNSLYPCYVESSLMRQIVIPAQAPVGEVLVREGDLVEAGRTLFRLDPERLRRDLKEKELDQAFIQREISIIEDSGEDLSKIPMKLIELSQATDAVDRIRRDLENLEWKAPFSGYVTRFALDLQPGAQQAKGTVVGEFASGYDCEILALVPETDILKIKPGSEVEVWFPLGEGISLRLTVSEVSPFKREDLQGSPFSSRFGGEIATRPQDERHHDTPVESYYLCKIVFPNQQGIPLGATGRLVVHSPPRSALQRTIEAAYRTFNKEILF